MMTDAQSHCHFVMNQRFSSLAFNAHFVARWSIASTFWITINHAIGLTSLDRSITSRSSLQLLDGCVLCNEYGYLLHCGRQARAVNDVSRVC
mmetsp:Transcript_22720/g.31704  ORF Transcript_22720/g.31704 Transcript_22720/m.31704 type:complete len:92 (-) Transcript_22720:35-310(-)